MIYFPGGAAKTAVHRGKTVPKKIVMINEACGGSRIDEAFLQILKDVLGMSSKQK